MITNNVLFDLFGLLIAALAVVIALVKWRYSYWARMGLEYAEPTFPFGSLWDSIRVKMTMGEDIDQFYTQMKSKGLKHFGFYFFHIPVYVPIDLDIIKHIMQVDFGTFIDRGVYFNERDDPLSAHLFAMEGAKWRNLRAKLSPTFTSGKMKMMFPLVVKTTEQLIEVLDDQPSEKPAEFKDILARLTTDIIGTCAFGLDCNSLRDPETVFRTEGKKIFEVSWMQRVTLFLSFVLPNLMKFFRVSNTPKSVEKFFMRVVKDTIKYRESNNVKRNDFMQLLIQLKSDGEVPNGAADKTESSSSGLTVEQLAAQAFVFFLAGFETSSTTMSFCLFELSQSEEIQNKLRTEINTVLAKHNGEFTYEAMMDMHYMDKVINETLRKYPPVQDLNRIANKDYKIPNSDLVIEKGATVFVPVYSIQHDPEYYPKPDVFDPTRFDDDQKQERHPFSFLPFGEGPRICIGLRFGVMQTKVGLTALLKNYRFKLNPQTLTPLRLDPEKFLSSAVGGIWMNIEKIAAGDKY